MSSRIDTKAGRLALMVAHCAGMVDLVALPVWVGTLVSRYGLDPQQAGLLATLFLAAAVLASVGLAPRFQRLPTRLVSSAGFGVAALGFGLVATTHDYAAMAALHALSGLAAGAALSVTHGTIARSDHPHRLFALVGIALGVFAVVFLGAMPPLVASVGGPALFVAFAVVMAVAALLCALAFPALEAQQETSATVRHAGPIGPAVWAGIAGVAAMALVQSMTFSFLERVGSDRGFGLAAVTGVLIALGIVNLFPAALAAVLERRWPAQRVVRTGPVLQAALAATIMSSTEFVPYAMAASVFAAVMIFTHTFVFGLLARLDPSGRALAATPAMVMTGAAVGPILGGTLVKGLGYGSLAVASVLVAAVATACFSRIPPTAARSAPHPVPV
jgi:predicted MFS family arabinose efflux permease